MIQAIERVKLIEEILRKRIIFRTYESNSLCLRGGISNYIQKSVLRLKLGRLPFVIDYLTSLKRHEDRDTS